MITLQRKQSAKKGRTAIVYRWTAACAAHRNGGAAVPAGPGANSDSGSILHGDVPCLEEVDFASVDSCAEHFLFPGDSDGPSCRRHLEPSWKRAKAKLSKG